MTTEVKRLIRVRVEKGATFKRDGFGKKRQLSDSWRKPRGQHNKQREQKKAKGALPKPGYGSPIAVRGMHPSGFFEVMVFSAKDLEGLNPKIQAVRIGGTVGERKRMVLQESALSAGLKVLNVKTAKAKETKSKKVDADRFSAGQKNSAEKDDKKKPLTSRISDALAPKKDAIKAKPAPVTEKKEVPVKVAKKSGSPDGKKQPEKTAENAKAPVKPAKKSEKPAAAKPKESGVTKAEAAAKPKSKKKSESGVKKNE